MPRRKGHVVSRASVPARSETRGLVVAKRTLAGRRGRRGQAVAGGGGPHEDQVSRGRRVQRGQSGEGSRKQAGRAGLLRGSEWEESSGRTAVPAGRRGRSQRQGACRGGDEKRRRGEVRPLPRVAGLDPSSFLHSHVALLPRGRQPAARSAGHSRARPRAGR